MKISQRSIKCLERHWKKGYFARADLIVKCKIELKRLGIIKYDDRYPRWIIDKEAYNKMMKGKQLLLT